MKKMLMACLAVLMLAGCVGDEFNTDRLVDDVQGSVGISIPLAKADVSIGDILSDQTDMVKYDGDRVILFQENDSLEYVGINDFFSLSSSSVDVPVPFQAFNLEPVLSADVQFSFSLPHASLSVADLNYTLSARGSNLEVPLLVSIILPADNGRVIELEVHNNSTVVRSFRGDRFPLADNKINIQVNVRPLYGSNFGSTMGALSLTLGDMSLNYIRGSMGEYTVNMKEGTYALDFDVLNDIPGEIEFADPRLHIIVDNATPFAGLIAADMTGRLADGSSIKLTSSPFTLEGKATDELTKRSLMELNKGNSSIQSFIAQTPEELNYAGLLTLNPGGIVSDEIEIYDADRIYVGYGFEVPLELMFNAALEEEVIALDDLDVLDELTQGSLVFTSENGLPLGASATVKFYDSVSASVIETMDVDIVDAATVDAEGKVNMTATAVNEVVLTSSQIESLQQADELRVTVQLNTSDYDKGQIVVFQKQNRLSLQLAIRGKIEYNN
ncbi:MULTISPECIES: hypothetical protein [unclassified Carboxylicivirga]|uniref:hypothetical protein n=1 Tax=Carboxylicivirga TaxID=1628153 RepID=UPI003D34EC15